MTFDLLTSEMNSVLFYQFKSFSKISTFEKLKIDSESCVSLLSIWQYMVKYGSFDIGHMIWHIIWVILYFLVFTRASKFLD